MHCRRQSGLEVRSIESGTTVVLTSGLEVPRKGEVRQRGEDVAIVLSG